MNLPNKLTLARVIAVPFYVVFMLTDLIPFNWLWALIIFIAASVTDWIDGRIARGRGLVTDLGKFLDPLADKILVSSALICMVELSWTYSFMVIIIIAREFVVSGLRLAAAQSSEHKVIAAGIWGKLKTAFTMSSIVIITLLFILKSDFGLLEGCDLAITLISDILMGISTLLTIISGIVYVVKYSYLMKGNG